MEQSLPNRCQRRTVSYSATQSFGKKVDRASGRRRGKFDEILYEDAGRNVRSRGGDRRRTWIVNKHLHIFHRWSQRTQQQPHHTCGHVFSYHSSFGGTRGEAVSDLLTVSCKCLLTAMIVLGVSMHSCYLILPVMNLLVRFCSAAP